MGAILRSLASFTSFPNIACGTMHGPMTVVRIVVSDTSLPRGSGLIKQRTNGCLLPRKIAIMSPDLAFARSVSGQGHLKEKFPAP